MVKCLFYRTKEQESCYNVLNTRKIGFIRLNPIFTTERGPIDDMIIRLHKMIKTGIRSEDDFSIYLYSSSFFSLPPRVLTSISNTKSQTQPRTVTLQSTENDVFNETLLPLKESDVSCSQNEIKFSFSYRNRTGYTLS